MSFINKSKSDISYFFSGTFYTGLSSVVGLLVPVILVPFLVENVGIKNYGISSVAFSISFFFSMIVDYGFYITGVNKLSKKGGAKKVSSIVSNVIYTKVFIFAVFLPVFLVLYHFITSNNLEWRVYLLSLCIPFASILNLSWALLGLHQIKVWSLLTILGQLFYIFSVCFFIEEPNDVIVINLCYGLGLLLSGGASLLFLRKRYHLQFIKIKLSSILEELEGGYHFFLSNIGNYAALYFMSPLVGFLLSYEMAGVYAIIEKIYNIARRPFSIYQTFMLPKISQQVNEDKKGAKETIRTTYLFVIAFMLFEIGLMFVFKTEIVSYFTTINLSLLENMLIISFAGVLLVIINCPVSLYLTALDKKQDLMKVSLFAPLFGVIMGYLFIEKFGIIGSVYTLVLIEFYYVAYLYIVYRKVLLLEN